MNDAMDKYPILSPLESSGEFKKLTDDTAAGRLTGVFGIDDTQRAHLLSALYVKTKKKMLIITSNERLAQRYVEDINIFTGGKAAFLPSRDISFMRTAASSKELLIRRIEVLGNAIRGKTDIIVAASDALSHRLMPRQRFEEGVLSLKDGMIIEPQTIIERLTANGYERVQLVEAKGQCALRGGILDVYGVGDANAVRIEFFDDEIDSVRTFDVMTQRSVAKLDSVDIYPASETLLKHVDYVKAAHELRNQIKKTAPKENKKERQSKIEKEFDLQPIEDFLKLTYDETAEDELPELFSLTANDSRENSQTRAEKEAPLSQIEKNFKSICDALESGIVSDDYINLLPSLLNYKNTVADYLDDPLIVIDQPGRTRERYENRFLEFTELYTVALSREEALPIQGELLFSYDELLVLLKENAMIIADSFAHSMDDFQLQDVITFKGRNSTSYSSNIKELSADIKKWKEDGWRIAMLAGGVARAQRLLNALSDFDIKAEYADTSTEPIRPSKPLIFPINVLKGFLYEDIRFAVIGEGDIYGTSRTKASRELSTGEKVAAFTEFKEGDYVVHENHGIGRYIGTIRLKNDGVYRDYFQIQYQGADKLYVPIDQLERVQKYIGSEGVTPKLNSLSGGEWQRKKAKVQASANQIAEDLIKLYAHREHTKGYAFDPDTPWQREFEDNFPYVETTDQLAAIADIKRDMEKPKIMDRLLCGDVGYGKTEVALRAIFKCVMSGKQAALLAPTTILVQQHYATMLNRLVGYPVRVETLSRFKTAKQQAQIISQLKEGNIDVIIGTHKLLAKNVEFKDLGLLVVDEEQRFGVRHKEAIKKLKESIDVLTLSATPIPRTLHMSMVGIRDMSLLQSPPEERYPVQTYVVEYSDSLVRDAILRELGRGGQVYVLYNHVQSIEIMFERLKRLVPEARIAIGHGQMREHALEDVMLDFFDGKFDVLLCTTIIEAGLDVPRANTLIICDADRFGLAQLYQLRGRVGRSNRLAYAYFTVNPRKIITETANKRLNAIKEFTSFGSGFRVAMRDLEIRGAGNLLGSEQSGFMSDVGYDLYVKLIEKAINEQRGNTLSNDTETRMDVKLDAYLPQEYVPYNTQRVEVYKKIAAVRTEDDAKDLIEELIDRFGDPTKPVLNLISIARLKNICSQLGMDLVYIKDNQLNMRFFLGAKLDMISILKAIHYSNCDTLRVVGNQPPTLVYYNKGGANVDEIMSKATVIMDGILSSFKELTANQEAGDE